MSAATAIDLSPLERAAERAGLGGVAARVVPASRRRGTWFGWGRGELRVSERIVERCAPEDAVALLVNAVHARRALRPVRALLAAGCLAIPAAVLLLGTEAGRTGGTRAVLVAVPLLTLAVCALLRGRQIRRADERTVATLGDATPLVRGLNAMSREEIRIGGRSWPARPDLHRRAERLVREHRLCDGGAGPASG